MTRGHKFKVMPEPYKTAVDFHNQNAKRFKTVADGIDFLEGKSDKSIQKWTSINGLTSINPEYQSAPFEEQIIWSKPAASNA